MLMHPLSVLTAILTATCAGDAIRCEAVLAELQDLNIHGPLGTGLGDVIRALEAGTPLPATYAPAR